MLASRLFFAAKTGRRKLTEILVDAGVPVNVKDEDGLNPLYYAVLNLHFETAIYLVKAGADSNVVDSREWTPLHFAARYGDRQLVEILVEAGADVNFQDRDGLNPLYFAASHRNFEVAIYLVKAGADCNVFDHRGWTPLRFAARNGHQELVEALVEAEAGIEEDFNGLNPLYFATLNRHYKTAAYLAKAGADSNVYDSRSWTPLHFAARYGHRELVEALVKAGADINFKDSSSLNPLYIAVESGHYEIAIYLVKAGSECSVEHWNGWTPLYCAARDDHRELLETLVKAGAKLKISPVELGFLFDEFEIYKTIIKYFWLYNTDPDESEFHLHKFQKLFHFWNICKDQVTELKCTFIGSNNTCLFKFLIESDVNKLANYLSADDVTEDLEKVLADEKFSVYNEMIKNQLLRGQKRKQLLQSIECLKSKCYLKILPWEVQNMIYSYLSDFDLINLLKYLKLFKTTGDCNKAQKGLKRKPLVPSSRQLRKRKS